VVGRLENGGLEDGGLDDLESRGLVDITDDRRSGVLILGAETRMIVLLGSVLSFGLNVHHRFLLTDTSPLALPPFSPQNKTVPTPALRCNKRYEGSGSRVFNWRVEK
jgi:hypothetical protein